MRLMGGFTALALSAAACDCGPPAGIDAGNDAGRPDAGPVDAGPRDAGPPDAGPPDSGSGDGGNPDLCGDRAVQSWERCDDGNRVSGDGCAGDCSGVEHLFSCPRDGGACSDLVSCGDAVVQGAERCDDGNLAAGDGCSPWCTLEPGWRCPVAGAPCLAARCGDGFTRGSEECDDSNLSHGDGCSASCRIEPGYSCPDGGGACSNASCGDLMTHPTESCDDGNSNFDDGCTPICTSEPDCSSGDCFTRCGDRVYQPDAGEECDDGDLRPGDGCTPWCTIEPGYTCTLAQPEALTLPIVLRDFRSTHPDFEAYSGDDLTIVLPDIGPDGKPVYARSDGGRSPTTTGKAEFDQWYNDVPGVNLTYRRQLALVPRDAGLEFGSSNFFPLDDAGFGNDGFPRNFHFTTETRFWFIHKGVERMRFEGDDDVFIYVNGKLLVNLGGIHQVATGTVVLDAATSAMLGIEFGKLYEVALFHAERRTVGSSFRLTLTNFDFELSRCARACGNAIMDWSEECDDGFNTGGYAKCGPMCRWDQWCGDGVVQTAHEQCDDGKNDVPYGDAGCAPSCERPHFCGDGHIDGRFGEQCDDGNSASGDGCARCRLER